MIFVILVMVLVAFAGIVVNERFGYGMPHAWLSVEALTFLIGLWLISKIDISLGLAVLSISDAGAIMGFGILLFVEEGPKRITKPIFPGHR